MIGSVVRCALESMFVVYIAGLGIELGAGSFVSLVIVSSVGFMSVVIDDRCNVEFGTGSVERPNSQNLTVIFSAVDELTFGILNDCISSWTNCGMVRIWRDGFIFVQG